MEQTEISKPMSYASVPVFDIPDFVLFPHTLVPFHVFEKRYGSMLDACLSDRRLMVIGGRKPGWDAQLDPDGHPSEVVGLGRVLSDRRFHDGRYNIFVHCIARVRVTRTHQFNPYRIVDVEAFDDVPSPSLSLDAVTTKMRGLGHSLARELGEDGGALSKILSSTVDAGVLSFRLAGLVLDELEQKQELMDLTSAYERCEILASFFAERLMLLSDEQPATNRWMN